MAPVVYGDIDGARLAVVLLHGRDQGPEYLEAELIAGCLRPDVVFIAPLAGERTWYPYSFLVARRDNQPRLDLALQRVGQVVEETAAQFGPDRVVLAGFSQGGCVACEWTWLAGRRLGALAAFTGGLIGPPGTEWAPVPSLAGMPVLLSSGEHDPFVPLERVRATASVFERSGAAVDLIVHPGDDHLIRDQERQAFAALLAALLGAKDR